MKDQLTRRARRWTGSSKRSARRIFSSNCKTTASRAGQGQPPFDPMGEGIRPEARRDERRSLHRKKPFARARLPGLHRHAGFVEQPKRMSAGYVPEQFYLRSAEEMKARFAETPEAVKNTLEVAEKCNLEIEFGKLHYPVFIRRNISRAKVFAQMARRRFVPPLRIHARAEGKGICRRPALTIRRGCRLFRKSGELSESCD
jgi:hypothetical protein